MQKIFQTCKKYFKQASAYASHDGLLTEKMVRDRVQDVLKQHRQKISWEIEEEARKRVPISIKEQSYNIVH